MCLLPVVTGLENLLFSVESFLISSPARSRTPGTLPSHFAPQCTGRENTNTRSSRRKTQQNFYYLSFSLP